MQKAMKSQMKRKPRNPKPASLAQLLGQPRYSGEPVKVFTLAAAPTLLSTTVTTGVIASSIALDARATVAGFLTRFEDTFDQYRVLRVTVRIRPTSVSTGVTRFWFESSLAAGGVSSTAASERVGRTLCNTSADVSSTTQMTYVCKDIQELEYVSVAATQEPAYPYFYTYTDLANWGAPATASQIWLIEPVFTVQFRGLAST